MDPQPLDDVLLRLVRSSGTAPTPVHETVIMDLLLGPQRLKSAAESARFQKDLEALAERDLDRVRLNVLAEVTDELGPDNKKRFTNEERRTAEVDRRLQEHADAARLRENLDQRRISALRADLELRYERDRFDAARAVARVLGGSV